MGLILLGSGLASAANPTPQQIKTAADEFDQGVKAAQLSKFDEAAAHFEAADREAPSPEALRAAIRARRDAKQGARASTLAALALARYPSNKELSELARGVVTQFSSTLHKVAVTCKPQCLLVVDNKLVPGEAAAELTLYLDPGKHSVAAGWGDKNQTKEVTALAAGSSALAFTPPAEPPPPASSAPLREPPPPASADPTSAPTETSTSRKPLPPVVTYVGIGATALLAGVTIWSGLNTQSTPGPDTVKQRCVGLGESCPEYQDGLSRQRRTNVLLAVTGGTALATALIATLFTDWQGAPPPSDSTARRSPSVLPSISFERGGATLQAAGRF